MNTTSNTIKTTSNIDKGTKAVFTIDTSNKEAEATVSNDPWLVNFYK